jgi:hypothetical protein
VRVDRSLMKQGSPTGLGRRDFLTGGQTRQRSRLSVDEVLQV